MTIKNKIQVIKNAIVNFLYPEIREKQMLNHIKLHLAKQRFEDLAYNSETSGIRMENASSEDQIIVSLTTHGKRIHTVHRTIESIFQQSVLAHKVVLYIGEDEYKTVEDLPVVLQRQVQRGLTIRFVEDQGPYTKLLPALQDFPDSSIITFDDDTLYPVNAIERLLKAHHAAPLAICALEARQIEWGSYPQFKAYDSFPFPRDNQDKCSVLYIAEGFGGVLYPPHCFTSEVFNQELFMQLAPTADDLWFKAMSLINEVPVLKVHDYFEYDHDRYLDEDTQDIGLRNHNLYQGGNDRQLKALCDYFNLYELLKE